MLFKFVLSAVSVALLLNGAYADNGNDVRATCAFSRPGKATCPRTGITSIAAFAGLFLSGNENDAITCHPAGICTIFNTDYVWLKNSDATVFCNGVYAYVLNIKGILVVISVVGCGDIYILTKNTPGLLTGARTLKNRDVYDAIYRIYKLKSGAYDSCEDMPPCNVVETIQQYGPSRTANLVGKYIEFDVSACRAIYLAPQTSENQTQYQLAKEARSILKQEGITDVSVMEGKYNDVVKLYINDHPKTPSCERAGGNIFENLKDPSAITSLQKGSACYAATYVGQEFAKCDPCRSSRGTYSVFAITTRTGSGYVLFECYTRTAIFDELWYKLFLLCQ